MNYLKKLGKSLIYVFSIMLVGIFIITLLNYIGFFNGKVFSFFEILILIISLFVGGFITGKNSKKKGWLEGIKLSMIIIVLFFIISYLAFKTLPELKTIIYYIIIITSSIIGSMIGINKNNNNNNN